MAKKNVYFFNRIKGFYRGQYSLKYFKDKFLQYNTFYLDGDYFFDQAQGPVAKAGDRLLNVAFRSRAIEKADLVWVPAMAYASTREWESIKKSRARVIFDYYVSQYENLTNEFRSVERQSAEGKKLRATEIDFMQRSEVTLFLTEAERSYFFEYLDFDHSRIRTEIVPLVVDRRAKARIPFAKGLSTRPVMAWWGTNLPLHGLRTLIQGLAILKNRGVDFLFYLIINNETRGADNQSLFALVHELGLEKQVVYEHRFSLHDFSLEDFLIQDVDLALGSFGGTRKGQSVLMNKVADTVSMSLPCLTEFSDGLQEFLKPDEDVFCCLPQPEALADLLEKTLSQPEKLQQLASRLEPIFEAQLSPNAYYKRLNRILEG